MGGGGPLLSVAPALGQEHSVETGHTSTLPSPTPTALTKPSLISAELGVRRPRLKGDELLAFTLELGYTVALALGLGFLTQNGDKSSFTTGFMSKSVSVRIMEPARFT